MKIITTSANADITFPNVVKLLLILAPSFKRVPLAPVESALSEPAKSTKLIFDTFLKGKRERKLPQKFNKSTLKFFYLLSN